MNQFLNKLQGEWNKLQLTVEKESGIFLERAKVAANSALNNPTFVEKRKDFVLFVEARYKKFEPTLDRIYKDVKGTAVKYGVDVDRLEQNVKSTTERAAQRLGLDRFDFAFAGASAKEAQQEAVVTEAVDEDIPAKKKPGRKKGSKKA